MREMLDHYLEERRILQPAGSARPAGHRRGKTPMIELGVNIDHVATLAAGARNVRA
jgi:hypothetical protein